MSIKVPISLQDGLFTALERGLEVLNVPPPNLMSDFKSDYKKMGIMFYETPPTFDELISKVKLMEDKINQV